jgi:hypothetical protein
MSQIGIPTAVVFYKYLIPKGIESVASVVNRKKPDKKGGFQASNP